MRVDPGTFPLPRILNEDGTLEHISCEGSREHVISFSQSGQECSESKCEINKKEKIMLNQKETKTDVGIIVGRFQVHRPHSAHIDLIESVIDKHDKVLIFLGLSPLRNTFNNPLDFRSREAMLSEHFKNKVEVHFIDDVTNDITWSINLDIQIQKWTHPNQSVMLYGSRDSFIPHYKGKNPTCELEPSEFLSGTEIRRKVINDYPNTEAYRAGVIAATGQRYPIAYTTVDVAVFDEKQENVLMAKKPLEDKWRFIGGFSDTRSESFEMDVKREVSEEADIEIDDIEYIGSCLIDDWRYRSEIDKIKTMFFKSKFIFGKPEGGDDIAYVKWVPLDEMIKLFSQIIVKEHWRLVTMLDAFIQQKRLT